MSMIPGGGRPADPVNTFVEKIKSTFGGLTNSLRRSQLQSRLNAEYARLGQEAYDRHLARPFLPTDLSAHFAEIEALRTAIASDGKVNVVYICSNCHRAVSAEAKFCPKCGQKMKSVN